MNEESITNFRNLDPLSLGCADPKFESLHNVAVRASWLLSEHAKERIEDVATEVHLLLESYRKANPGHWDNENPAQCLYFGVTGVLLDSWKKPVLKFHDYFAVLTLLQVDAAMEDPKDLTGLVNHSLWAMESLCLTERQIDFQNRASYDQMVIATEKRDQKVLSDKMNNERHKLTNSWTEQVTEDWLKDPTAHLSEAAAARHYVKWLQARNPNRDPEKDIVKTDAIEGWLKDAADKHGIKFG